MKNVDYLVLIKNLIIQEKLKYAIPVNNLKFIENLYNSNDIHFVIDDDTFLEALFLRVRGETIKFSSTLKKTRDKQEKALINDIAVLENSNILSPYKLQILDDKKQELEDIREIKIQGHVIRSRLKWHGSKKERNQVNTFVT